MNGVLTAAKRMLPAVFIGLAASPLGAQLPNPSAEVLGMGGNQTALARGFSALSLNPAGLAMPGGPRASATFAAIRGVAGLGPIGLGDLAEVDGEPVVDDVREGWLERITRAGGERGWAGADLTYLSTQVGRFAFQLSTTGDVVADLGPGAAELALFGNAGRTGEPADIELRGSSFDMVMATTMAVGYGHPVVRTPERSIAVGATLKYSVGHVLVTAMDVGGAATAQPVAIAVRFPIVQSESSLGIGGDNRGSGLGLDVGLSWREGRFVTGLAIRNLFNTFAWDEDDLLFRPGTISATEEEIQADFDLRPYREAPHGVRERVGELDYPLVVAVGVGYLPRPDLRLSADVRQQVGDARTPESATHLGGAAEYRPVPWLPLRAAVAVISGGYLFSSGVGLDLAPVRIDVGAARRRTGLGMASQAMLTFSVFSR